MLVQEPGHDPRHVRPGVLLVGRAAPGLHLLVGSAGRCFSSQNLFETCLFDIGCGACTVIKQYDEPLRGVHGIFINMTGAVVRRLSVWVSSDRAVHTANTVLFPCLATQETMSQARSASKHETSVVPEFSQGRAISWASKKWKAFPIPKETNTSVSPFSVCARATARTTTSVSAIRMRIFCDHCEQCGHHATLCGCWLLRGYMEPGRKYPEEVACSRHHLL